MTKEEKMKIVINNYFKTECSVNTSIREAFEKGFRIGASKVQNKHGKWIGADNDKVKCNQCGKSYDWTSQAQYYDYCPNCGAKMDGEQ